MATMSFKQSSAIEACTKSIPFHLNLMRAHKLRASPFPSWEAWLPTTMWSQQDKVGNMAWEEQTIHQIVAITAFPFHMGPQRGHILMKTLFCMWNRGWPSFFYPEAPFKEANEHKLGTSILQDGGSHSSTVPSVKIHVFKKSQTQFCIHTNPLLLSCPTVFFLPAVTHKWSKPSSTFKHYAPLKGRLAGDVEKSCIYLNMSLKSSGGDILNTVWNGFTVLTRAWRSEAAVLAAAAAAGLLGITVTQALPKASLNATKAL